jgi:hypothetical protein
MIATMARKRTQPAKPAPEPVSPASDRHKVSPISFRPSAGLREVLQRLADKDRRSLSQTIELLLEESLKAKGLYTPEAEEG